MIEEQDENDDTATLPSNNQNGYLTRIEATENGEEKKKVWGSKVEVTITKVGERYFTNFRLKV
jgi:hypothetical protein